VLKRPVVSVVIAGLLPNIATAAFNFLYNLHRIEDLGFPALVERFWDVQWWLNILAFSSGIGVGAWIAVRALRLLKTNATPATAETSGEVLLFGRFVSMLVLALWTVSGIAFPILVGPAHAAGQSMSFVMHFFASLAVCGCAAMAYPYFLITAMSTHYFLPEMVRRGALPGPTPTDLERVAWYNRLHLALAALVPLLGVTLATAFAEQESVPWWALPVASGGGLLMLLVVGYLWRVIELDTAALEHLSLEEARSGGSIRSSRRSHRRSRK
jgi:hypothetical protein